MCKHHGPWSSIGFPWGSCELLGNLLDIRQSPRHGLAQRLGFGLVSKVDIDIGHHGLERLEKRRYLQQKRSRQVHAERLVGFLTLLRDLHDGFGRYRVEESRNIHHLGVCHTLPLHFRNNLIRECVGCRQIGHERSVLPLVRDAHRTGAGGHAIGVLVILDIHSIPRCLFGHDLCVHIIADRPKVGCCMRRLKHPLRDTNRVLARTTGEKLDVWHGLELFIKRQVDLFIG
mmetsp:Transcript_12313/g.21025  ORF Transcript_12313/g.21025 Transcript_12313/m.21025 type:complete len:230 (+) Transcript_12313:454-1143(+)